MLSLWRQLRTRLTAGGKNTASCNWASQKLKDLQKESARLKRDLATLTLEKQILKDLAEGNF